MGRGANRSESGFLVGRHRAPYRFGQAIGGHPQRVGRAAPGSRVAAGAAPPACRRPASVQKEISLVEQRIATIEGNVKVGVVSPQDAELLQLRRDLLGLQRKLAEFQAGAKRQR
jgi:hypothetical protein